MRNLTPTQDNIWQRGDYSGPNRAMARVTIAHHDMVLHDLGYNVYADFIFGQQARTKELPNVKKLSWSRGADTDVASGTLELYNTAPQPLGTVFQPQWGLDQPGYYTFNRGSTSYSSRWGHEENEWKNLIVGDNILRTYEGYGFDPDVCPDADPNLVQTGMWIIKDVTYTASGLITIAFEDMGAILRDQVCFHPVIPPNFYPLSFTARPKTSGFTDGRIYTVSENANGSGGFKPPADWDGPTNAVTGIGVNDRNSGGAGDGKIVVTWSPAPAPPAGFTHVGYQLVIDGVRLGTIYTGTTATYNANNGNVYGVQVVNLYKRTKDGHEQVGDNGTPILAHPHYQYVVGAITNVVPQEGPPPGPGQPTVPFPTYVSFDVGYQLSYASIVLFKKNGSKKVFRHDPPTYDRQHVDLGESVVGWNVLVYPVLETVGNNVLKIGAGDLVSQDGSYLNPPTDGVPPHLPNPAPGAPVVTTKTGKKKVINPVNLGITLSNTSNTYYNKDKVIDAPMYGHHPHDALDNKDSTYWLSVGNEGPGEGFAYEWFEVNVKNQEVSEVSFKTAKGNYEVYLSVFSNGKWIHHKKTDVIGYNAKLPESHNGGNIPFCEIAHPGKTEGPHTITLRSPIPKVTKVRLTFHNLQDFNLGTYQYRAGLREINVFGTSTTTTSTTTTTTTTPPPVDGPPQDDNSPDITKTFTVYVPPAEIPGAGENPGTYEDYTDIVKLLLAWGGFFWPDGAKRMSCDGSETTYSWGDGPYGLKNVDPVLGDQESGRVWGDFMSTGTAGIVALPIPQWDKKSLLDSISYVRDIIGYLFFIDEEGAAVWRLPNIFAVGNYVGDRSAGASRVGQIVTIDETQTLMELRTKVSSRNVRERYFIAGVDGKTGALGQGFNPNPTGLRRVGGWTDQHFGSNVEAQIMVDQIALRALMAYRVDTIQVPGYPRIQVDDQVRIFEQTTSEGYLHYVRAISSNNDLENGVWTYDLDTNWLGESPFTKWAFDPAKLSQELQQYLTATEALGAQTFDPPPSAPDDPAPAPGSPPSNPPGATGNPAPSATPPTTKDVPKVAKLVKAAGQTTVYITDGITKRRVVNQADIDFLAKAGLVPTKTPTSILAAELNAIPTVP